MRILHVEKFVRRDRGGAPAYMFDVMERQRANGSEVEVFGMAGPDNEPARYGDSFAPPVQLNPPPPGAVAKVRTAARMLWSQPAADALDSVLADFRPDIVHCHNIYHQLTPAVLEPIAARGVPAVMTVHDFKLVCPTYHLLDHQGRDCTACVGHTALHVVRKRCEDNSVAKSAVLAAEAVLHRRRKSYDTIERFLCPSRYMVDRLTEGGLDPASLLHLPNAVVIPADGHPEDRPRPGRKLLFVGRLVHQKGVDLLIDAVAGMPGITLTICGDGPEMSNLQQQAREIEGRIDFAGHVTHDRIRAELREAAALVLPSRGSENQPLTILDAFANGVPVIASASRPIRELVVDDLTGTLFRSGDAGDLARAVSDLLADEDRRHRMAVAARHTAARDHDVDDHLARLEAIYREVAA